jgi:hypothetical protein
VVIAATGGGWDARGHLLSDNDEEREGFAFLCDLDPVFMLRFEDESTIPVTVHTLEEDGRFALTEYTGPAHRSISGWWIRSPVSVRRWWWPSAWGGRPSVWTCCRSAPTLIRARLVGDAEVVTGDARNLAALATEPIDLCLTSPPYMTSTGHP